MTVPEKGMGLWSAISIGVDGMVGAGIFAILGIACRMSGSICRALHTFSEQFPGHAGSIVCHDYYLIRL